jgi:hypothetical protein
MKTLKQTILLILFFLSAIVFAQNEKEVLAPVKFEHLRINVPDKEAIAKWYVEFMDLNVPWSKDIDATNNIYRNYRVPYVGDAARSLSVGTEKRAPFSRLTILGRMQCRRFQFD